MDYSQIVRDATAERHALLDKVAKLDALIASAAALASGANEAKGSLPARVASGARSSAISPTRDAVRSILRERGQPILTRDLVPLVRAVGIEVGGQDPIATLSARLSNSPDVKVHRGIGWWFTDEPLPGILEGFEEAAGATREAEPAASNFNQGGSEDAAALASNPDR